MINSSDQKCFICIGLKKISLSVLDSKKNFLYTKEILIRDLSIEENFQTLEKFLNQNVLEVEKNLTSIPLKSSSATILFIRTEPTIPLQPINPTNIETPSL